MYKNMDTKQCVSMCLLVKMGRWG